MKEYKIIEVKKRDAEKTMNAMSYVCAGLGSCEYDLLELLESLFDDCFFKRSIKDWNRMHTSSIVLQ